MCRPARLFFRAAVLVFLLFGASVLPVFAFGRSETAGDDRVDTGADFVLPPEEMRQLVAMSARFGGDAGLWTSIDLPPEFQDQSIPRRLASGFATDFSRALIPYDDIIAGGPPKDGIPSIDNPVFTTVAEAGEWISDEEPVILFRHEGEARIYPLQILTWHEIVNDTVAGRPVAVTYCPLCNTGMVFDRRFADETLEFGVSGRLIYSNMIMYDRSHESWWIQATGQAIAGHFAGQRLRLLPSSILSWREVRQFYPNAEVLSRDTGHRRDYGRNPYTGYDSADEPFLYQGPGLLAGNEHAMERILSVYHEDQVQAVPYDELRERRVVHLSFADARIVVFWSPGTASALDSTRIQDGRDVGSAAAYYLEGDHAELEFVVQSGEIRDRQTSSVWTTTGRAVSGPGAGIQLRPALAVEHFRFSWRAFH